MTTLEAPAVTAAETVGQAQSTFQGLHVHQFLVRLVKGGLPAPDCLSDHNSKGQRHNFDAYNDQTDLDYTETAIPVSTWYAAYARRHTPQDRPQ